MDYSENKTKARRAKQFTLSFTDPTGAETRQTFDSSAALEVAVLMKITEARRKWSGERRVKLTFEIEELE